MGTNAVDVETVKLFAFHTAGVITRKALETVGDVAYARAYRMLKGNSFWTDPDSSSSFHSRMRLWSRLTEMPAFGRTDLALLLQNSSLTSQERELVEALFDSLS